MGQAAPAQTAPASDIELARQQKSRNSEALAKFPVPRHIEPAFRFEA